jgi:hypothetical protein
MTRALLAAALAFATSAGAQGLAGDALCQAVWTALADKAARVAPLTGQVAPMQDGACVFTDLHFDLPGDYTPDWRADRLVLSGGALGWSVGEPVSPDRLEIAVEGLRFSVTTGMAQLDYLYAAQARAAPIRARAVLAWDAGARTLTLDAAEIDFPGDNLVRLSAVADGVDLSSTAALQMSATGFRLRAADLSVRTHGLFEWYALLSLGPMFLPPEGDMDTAMAALKAEATEAVRALPEAHFPAPSKAALAALIAELPNPAGRLDLAFRAEGGFGPARFAGYAATGVPDNLAEAAPLLDGVTFAIGWTHEDSP